MNLNIVAPYTPKPIAIAAGAQVSLSGAGAGYIEYTNDSMASVIAGTAAWKTWPRGAVSNGSAIDVTDRAMIIRVQATSGALTLSTQPSTPQSVISSWEWQSQRTINDPAGQAAMAAGASLGGVKHWAFEDRMQRADTFPGSIGAGWVLKAPYAGSYPLPASAYGNLTNQTFVVPTGQIVYAFRTLRSAPKIIQTQFSWVDLGAGAGTQFRTLAIAICANPITGASLDTMLHMTLTNSQLLVQKRIGGGAFQTIATWTPQPGGSLAIDGSIHMATVIVNGNTVRYLVDDAIDLSVTDPDVPALMGPTAFVEHYSGGTDLRWPLSIYRVAYA